MLARGSSLHHIAPAGRRPVVALAPASTRRATTVSSAVASVAAAPLSNHQQQGVARAPARSRRRDGHGPFQNNNTSRLAAAAASANANNENENDDEAAKSGEYSKDMQAKMGTTLTYRHELGINWDRITDDLIVGSCLQTPEDVDRLVEEENITTVFCLQEDCDLAYFGIDVEGIAARCSERGDIRHVRFPIRDFDPFELRRLLPRAVARLAQAHRPRPLPRGGRDRGASSPAPARLAGSPHPATLPSPGSVYIHCTAGMGRAPAAALAYLTWLRGWDLDEAYALVTGSRACSPKIEAVRSATADLLLGSEPVPVTVSLPRRGTVQDARVAGLDVGWGEQLPMAANPKMGGRLEVTRLLLPGRYPFKFVLDGKWAASHDYPTVRDGDNVNNVLEVLPRDEIGGGGKPGAAAPRSPAEAAARAARRNRLAAVGGRLTDEERMELAALLCPWATHRKTDHLTPADG